MKIIIFVKTVNFLSKLSDLAVSLPKSYRIVPFIIVWPKKHYRFWTCKWLYENYQFFPNYQFSVKIINPSKNSYRLRVGCIEVVKKTYRCCFGCTEVNAKIYWSRVGSMEVGTDHTHSRLLELPRLLWLKSFRFSRSANNSPSLPAQWPNACTTQPPSTPSAGTRHAAHRAPARLHSKASQ